MLENAKHLRSTILSSGENAKPTVGEYRNDCFIGTMIRIEFRFTILYPRILEQGKNAFLLYRLP